MRDFISSKVKTLRPSGIRKFFDIAKDMEGVISLGVGEPDFETPWHIREEGIYSLEQGNTIYTSNAGLKELRQEIAKYMKRKYRLEYKWDTDILVTVGGSEAIDVALRSVIEPNDEVIIATPCFVSYEPCAILAGAKVVPIALKKENDFKLTPEELESVITNNSKILLINYPNNPTGAIMTKEDLEKLSEVIIRHDLLVISDEIYSELTYSGTHCSIAAIPNMKQRTIVINGFSKTFSMTGWRLGYACGPTEIIRQMTKIHQFAIMCAPTTSQFAAVDALKYGDKDVEEMKTAYDERRRYVIYRLREMGLPCFTPQGAFYIFADIRRFGYSSEEFALKLLNEEKVVVVPGNAFGESGEGFIRISYAYSLESLKMALARVEKFLRKINK